MYWLDAISLETIDENNTAARADNTIIGTVNGTVQLSTGANQPVTLTLVDLESAGATFTRTTTTTADGTYHFSDVPAGNYELRATSPTGTVEAEPYQFLISERPNEPMNFVMEGAVSTSYLPLIMR